ncbi:3-deoxy-7-phosphoheptulonate synthase [Saccharopolyspora sp. ASAGF58]|uniref:3-deoxy-7-phosphoheptulonate synthase n=1 Tax=Saccharopolyspora sp. ASAGF58 TaxID=2719023 RepID=UPI00143FD6B4|nr:3-deoxy-7-phosphoheptulonate synthase [Saccharopolyspora sp. ASAGF58]QIZ37841.1 3-deoxy-7-phosphoheptulonate synthase [Saccharopolyspora sp. ASAGF58]
MTAASELIAAHQPAWSEPDTLREVLDRLRWLPPLVEAEDCACLVEELAAVARGEGVVLQAGDCAELFTDSAPDRIRAKAAQLHELGGRLRRTGRAPVVVGRLAGQYAKPRSRQTEAGDDGVEIPVYLGDAVNDRAPTGTARRPDPQRLLAAYAHTSRGLRTLASGPATYTSHEALLLNYERALLRPDPVLGGVFASSAHTVWIGERTRDPGGAHVEFAAEITNPVGVKIGPDATPADVVALVARLAENGAPGRLSLVVRMGVDRIGERLPLIVQALGEHADRVVWLSDPMHGNTVRSAQGLKTRVLRRMTDEIERFCAVLRLHGVHPGGLHLEITPDGVIECVDTGADLATGPDPCRYTSACDPRLNPHQAVALVDRFAEVLATG